MDYGIGNHQMDVFNIEILFSISSSFFKIDFWDTL